MEKDPKPAIPAHKYAIIPTFSSLTFLAISINANALTNR